MMQQMTDKNNILIALTGATASGKSALAIRLAQHYDTEIVSADSRQIYAGIPIGTAAPTPQELACVKHHLVGTLQLSDYYSAAQFETDALEILDGIWSSRQHAVVCGGSMMYVDALIKGIDEMPSVSEDTRRYVLNLLETQGLEGVLAQLQIVDPEHYEIVDRANTRRVVHALEVSLQAGVPYSEFRTGRAKQRPFTTVKLAIDMPRNQLFDRINARVEAMIENGLVEEAARAWAQGDFNSLNTVGYKEMKWYLDGSQTLEFVRDRIAKNTRVYAKKQLTWLRRDTSVVWLDPENAFEQAVEAIDAALQA